MAKTMIVTGASPGIGREDAMRLGLDGFQIIVPYMGDAAMTSEIANELSSSVIAKSFPEYAAYSASKAGVKGLIRVLAQELRGRNISVNAVAPGPVVTPMFLEGKTEEQIAQLSKIAPMERLGEPSDVARVVSFLLGQDGGWVNPQVVRANGGYA